MFSRKSTAERTTAQAWDYLSSAWSAAGETGKQTAGVAGAKATELAAKAAEQSHKLAATTSAKKSYELAGKAGTKVNKLTDEAWGRANLAANALAGRKPGLPWGLLIGAGLVGVAVGWIASATVRAAAERQAENEELELAETAIVVTPTYEN
ncbi:hypothetical protein [Actinoplanes sp. N902-109]|uniref:hypothetical protein n=1 Tax=Actinoplanes sp. (strain N902-109) TaxID=649831 RepID=UPI0003294AF3|nr:hypothetical protein [Actinoplanes sp. N902-109]AGL15253.1 hypothetical protein L083_1743 [Actinoplanes sp. N902-109]